MKMREIKIKCKFCGKIQAVNVDENRYRKWVDGELIQRAMPDLNDFEREALISELCYDCQSKIYNMPKPGEDWGKQIGNCECCDCAIWEKDINKEGASFCPNCGSPLE